MIDVKVNLQMMVVVERLNYKGEYIVALLPRYDDSQLPEIGEKLVSVDDAREYVYEKVRFGRSFYALSIEPYEHLRNCFIKVRCAEQEDKTHEEEIKCIKERLAKFESQVIEELQIIGLVLSSPFYTKQLTDIYNKFKKEEQHG